MADVRASARRTPVVHPPEGLVGRDAAFTEGLRAVLGGRSVLFVGAPGVGASALATAVAAAAAEHGRVIGGVPGAVPADSNSAVAVPSLEPFGPTADVLHVDSGDATAAGLEAAVDAVREGRCSLIGAVSVDARAADAGPAEPLLMMWRGGRALRIDVGPLDPAGVGALVDLVAAGRGVSAVQRALIGLGSAGLPRLVVVLTEEMLAGVTTSDWDLRPPPARLMHLVLPCLRSLGTEARRALKVARLLDGVQAVRLRRVMSDRCFRELTLTGVLQIDPVGSTCHVPSAYSRVSEWVDPIEAADRLELARALIDDAVLRLEYAPQELAVLAAAQLDEPGVLGDMEADGIARILAGGSLRAALVGQPERAYDFAVAAAAADPVRARLVDARREALTRKGPAPGWRRYDAALRGLDWEAARSLAEAVPADAEDVERLDALGVLSVIDVLGPEIGPYEDRLEAVRAICSMPAVFASASTRSAGHLPTAATAVAFVRAVTSTITPEFATDLEHLIRWTAGQGHRSHYAQLAAASGLASHMRGDFVRSEVDFGLALHHGLPDAAPLSRSWVHGLRALALHELGRASEARIELAAAHAERGAPGDWDDIVVLLARGIMAAGTAEGPAALGRVLVRGLELGASSPMTGLLLAHQAVRLGAGDGTTADRVDAMAGAVGLPVARTMAATVRGILDGTAPRPSGAVGYDEEHALFTQDAAAGRGPDTGAPISSREREVAELAAEGLGNAAIAARLFLSARTVESHLYNLRRKLGAVSRLDYARLIAERGRRTR